MLTGQKHLFEEQVVLVVVVDKACASHKVVLILEFLWEFRWITEGMLIKLLVNAFFSGLLKHLRTYIEAVNIFESLFCQVFPDETGAASQIQNLSFGKVQFVFLGKSGAVVSNEFRIRVSCSQVHTLVV